MPVAIALMAGGVDFGRAYLDYGTAQKSVRNAARYLARVPKDQVCNWGISNAKNMALYGSITTGTTPLVTGWASSNIVVNSPTCSGGTATYASNEVDITATVNYAGTMLGVVGLGNVLTAHVRHREPYVGD